MYKNGDICPVCETGHLHKVVKDKEFKYKGERLTIKDITVYACDGCEESLIPKRTINSTEKSIRDFHRKVDELLTSDQIKKVRRALGFTQEDFANILGVAPKSFARYENGTVTQNRTTDHLLRILFENPDTLKIINKEAVRGIPLKSVAYVGGGTFYNPGFGADNDIRYKVTI